VFWPKHFEIWRTLFKGAAKKKGCCDEW